MIPVIHALMKDANNDNAVSTDSIDQGMRSKGKQEVVGGNSISLMPKPRTLANKGKRSFYPLSIALNLSRSPLAARSEERRVGKECA